MTEDARRHSDPAERNKQPIVAELLRLLPPSGLMLEIASGTGQHAAHAAAALPGWRWQPTDANPRSLPSITAWCEGLANVLPPLLLDVESPGWPGVPPNVDAAFCANLIHIAPWPVCSALMQGVAQRLAPQGRLVMYGPYVVEGEVAAPGNVAFDADLRSRNEAWGLRKLGDVQAEAGAAGLQLLERVAMPANNLLLVFGRT
jgi:hypothetical protein